MLISAVTNHMYLTIWNARINQSINQSINNTFMYYTYLHLFIYLFIDCLICLLTYVYLLTYLDLYLLILIFIDLVTYLFTYWNIMQNVYCKLTYSFLTDLLIYWHIDLFMETFCKMFIANVFIVFVLHLKLFFMICKKVMHCWCLHNVFAPFILCRYFHQGDHAFLISSSAFECTTKPDYHVGS